jgi:hypothetical protein
LAVSAAVAQERDFGPLTYDYLIANLGLTALDNGGIELGGSVAVADRVHVFGGYQDWELGSGADRSILQLGAGYRWDLAPNLDLAARVALASSDLDRRQQLDLDDEGLIISGLLRGWIADRVELSGELLLDDSLGSDIETVLEFGGQYYVNDEFSVGGRIRVDEDETSLFLGGRFYFRGWRRSAETAD